jgi:outer membrane protein assembly factor BamA
VNREASIGFSAKLNQAWKTGLHLVYQNVGITNPPGGHVSAQDFFRNDHVPGLFTGANLLGAVLSVDHNTKDREHNATRGGIQHVQVGLNEGISKGDFSYWKFEFDVEHFFALTRDRRKIVAVRGMTQTNQERGGSQVPFFDMPYIGSWETVRGFDNYRFTDKSAVALGLEYRYRIWRAMDWGLFVDTGQVAPEPGDFGFDQFHLGYGVRLIMLPKPDLPVAVDVAHSNESWRLYFNFNSTF